MIFYRQGLEIHILHALCTDPGAIGAWIAASEVAFDLDGVRKDRELDRKITTDLLFMAYNTRTEHICRLYLALSEALGTRLAWIDGSDINLGKAIS